MNLLIWAVWGGVAGLALVAFVLYRRMWRWERPCT